MPLLAPADEAAPADAAHGHEEGDAHGHGEGDAHGHGDH